jgi:hypothetical protein
LLLPLRLPLPLLLRLLLPLRLPLPLPFIVILSRAREARPVRDLLLPLLLLSPSS